MSQQPNRPVQYFGAPMPQPGYPMPRRSSAPRTAFILQLILGGIVMLLGTCAFAMNSFFPDVMDTVFRQQVSNMPNSSEFTEADFHRMNQLARGAEIFILASGLLLLVLAYFVLRGSRPATRISLTVAIMIGVLFLLNFLGGMAQLGSNPIVVVTLVMIGGLVGLSVFLVVKLLAAMKTILLREASGPVPQVPMPSVYGPPMGYPPPPPPGAGPVGSPRG